MSLVDDLVAGSVSLERDEGLVQDERGMYRGHGSVMAWFRDPAGNILSVLEKPYVSIR